MNQNPLVSIVIPVYNGANYVGEAIESALAQTYRNIEIVVVNDGSKDEGATDKVVKLYGDKVHYILKENGGVSSALNRGIREMKGEYFSWLSHDDLYTPDKIEKQVALIQSKNDIILCSGTLIDKTGNTIPYPVKTKEGRLTGLQLFKAMLHDYWLNGLGFLVPTHVFDKVGDFDESMRYLQDLDLWLRILMHEEYTFICHKDLLVVTRVHKGQQTNTISHVYDVDCRKMAIKHIDLISQDPEIIHSKELYELYYKLFVKDNNRNGVEEVSKILIRLGYTLLQLKMLAFPYYVRGRAKSVFRLFYNIVLKLKGERN